MMSANLYVGNLSYDTDEQSLQDFFTAEGHSVLRTKVVLDRDTGRSRGFGFVEIDSSDVDALAESFDGRELDGRRLNVREARERTERPAGGGYGGGGGYRGGNGDRGGYGGGGKGRSGDRGGRRRY